jgi:Na+/alanine symporter
LATAVSEQLFSNIAGVVVAIGMGGPALHFDDCLWFGIGMSTCGECTLGGKYRDVGPDGQYMVNNVPSLLKALKKSVLGCGKVLVPFAIVRGCFGGGKTHFNQIKRLFK